MRRSTIAVFGMTLAIVIDVALAAPPVIISLQTNRVLTWSSRYTNGIAIIEKSTNLLTGSWSPYYYDIVTNSPRSTRLPPSSDTVAFYRIALQTNPPDPSLIMWLSFDNDFSQGTVLDVSGHGNNGLRYGRPCCPTNWPSPILGPDGSQAAEFHVYYDGWADYGKSGDYVGIPRSADFTNLPQATISAWVYYYTSINSNYTYDGAATPLNAGFQTPGAWTLGRNYAEYTSFLVYTSDVYTVTPLNFPDAALTGNSGGWHFYAVTFDRGAVAGYFDGFPIPAALGQIPVSALSMGGQYIGMACWTFNETPEMDLSVDQHPNNAWMNGAIDDVRVYRRVLTASQILALYDSFDKIPPSIPTNVMARAAASSQVELRWGLAVDNFRVAGYRVHRNGTVVGSSSSPLYVDAGLAAGTTFTYTVQAFDGATNYSEESAGVTITTPPPGSPVDVILDDADGPGWVDAQGTWNVLNDIPGYWGNYFHGGTQAKGAGSVTFRPSIPIVGNYGVYVWNPGAASFPMYNFASNVPVDIVHGGVTNTVVLNEQTNYASWNYLGTYTFNAGTNNYVRIRTDGTSTDFVTADAARFVK
jgi:concanavalin A-like lectin/glucanase superfamily protein